MTKHTSRRVRRRDQRVVVRSWATIQVSGLLPNDQAFGHVINVSRTGILVQTPQPPPLGQKAVVRATAGEQVFAMQALVVRVDQLARNRFDVALQFLAAERQQMEFLQAFAVPTAS